MLGKKHAYCIMAHGNFHQLQRLVDALDDERNDLFLHIDRKCQYKNDIIKTVKSNLYFVERVDVRWSDISLCDAEINLYKSVLSVGISYHMIHLISGVDLPLKSQDEIHDFFENRNEECINIRTPEIFVKRIKYYHFFVRNRRSHPIVDFFRRILLVVQLPFINRLKKLPLQYAYGSEWCSLTIEGIREIVSKFQKYRYVFEYTTCADELYKQMILYSNPAFLIASEGALRYVDFSEKKPSPKILRMEDFDKMMGSGCLFARKFDENVDKRVIDKILDKITVVKK